MTLSAPRGWLERAPAGFAILACLAAVALLAGGCGGNSSPSVASLGPTTTASGGSSPAPPSGGSANSGSTSQGSGGQRSEMTVAGGSRSVMAAYAACMRRNGEPNFPDPNAQGQLSFGSANGIDPTSAQFQQAQKSCQKLLPNRGTPSPAEQAQGRSQALAFSACMRKNGVPNFPDPEFSSGGGVSIRIGSSSGIDPRSPEFQAAQKACQKNLPGKPVRAAPPPSGSTGGGE